MGQPIYPRNDLSYAGNFMRMMFATPCEEYRSTPCSNALWIASSSCTLTTSKTHPHRPCACAARPAPTLRSHRCGRGLPVGPAHGGANEACLNMLEDIQRNGGVAKVGEFMEKVRTRTPA